MELGRITLLGIFFIISVVNSFPEVSRSHSLVVSTISRIKRDIDDGKKQDNILPKIYEMRVDANITNRFANCLVTSKVRNVDKKAHEATFSVIIPDQAYISGFIMEIDGKKYVAYVEEKDKAKKTYENAVSSGQGAAHVAVSARDSHRFTVSVNIEPQTKAIFYLKYEELLARQKERYELVINIHPGQPVKKLDIQVNIDESRPLKFVTAPSLRSGNEIGKNNDKLNPNADIQIKNNTAVVKFSPDISKQKQYATDLGSNAENGLAGQFIVQYDVERDPHGGEVLVNGGYFVHFFAPKDLPALPKQIIFILDTSGSMENTRIAQLKQAMKSILRELKPEDVFSIVEFSSIVKVWNIEKSAVQYQYGSDSDLIGKEDRDAISKKQEPVPDPYPASKANLENAEKVVEKLQAIGGTDINSALKIGLQLVQKNVEDKTHQPIIIFLTDGEATIGETNTNKIITTISELNTKKTPIFCLSFGAGADRKFLEKLSLKNFGFTRHIYEAADASLQLQEFYKEISSPLLSNVTFKYVSNVTELTRTEFPILFDGAELIVCGLLVDPKFTLPRVHGRGINGTIQLTPVIKNAVGNIERVWAYLTLKQILEKREAADNKTELTKEALKIALKYSFVSDVSSLVVVKPNQTSAVDTEDGSIIGRPYLPGGPVATATSQSGSFHISPILKPGGLSGVQNYDDEIVDTRFSASSPTLSFHTLTQKLPWLVNILNTNNNTLDLTKGNFKFGFNEFNVNIKIHPDCPESILKSPGVCTLIFECPDIFDKLTSLAIYEKYFCDLQGYAGVCCPKMLAKV